MNRFFYLRLAAQNIRKNAQTYIPYILTCTGSVMMFDIILTLAGNREIAAMHGGSDMRTILNLGCFIIALFAGGFLFYTNSFFDEASEDGDRPVQYIRHGQAPHRQNPVF